MKKIIYLILFITVGLTTQGSHHQQRFVDDTPVPLGDPFIMLHENTYYAYGTNAKNGIEVYISDDLLTWKKQSQLALKSEDSWGDRWFWAPEIYYIKETNQFLMYYSADEHICIASSDSPLGPFKQEVKEPLLSEKAIDNTLFLDDDGKAYTYFDRFNDGLNIWVAELEDDLKTIKQATLKKCINVSQPWEEIWPRVNEGAFVVKYKGMYYLTYSANSYESPFYGIGFATATSPTGPWKKYSANPILQKPRDLVGVGHSAMFRDKTGQLKIVFHAHHSKDKIHPRAMYISEVTFTNDKVPVMKISENIVRPTLIR